MKTSLLIILSICIISCSKNKQSPARPTPHPQVDSSSISFRFNDTLVTIKGGLNSYLTNREGVYASKVLTSYPKWVYNISAQSGFYNDLLLQIYTDSLLVQPYNYFLTQPYYWVVPDQGLFLGIQYKNRDYQIYLPNDSVNVNITSFSNGYISGTFSADLTPMDSANPVSGSTKITDGSFQNLQIVY